MTSFQDTIYALATPPGKSGVAVVRVSGPEAEAGLMKLCAKMPKLREAALRTLVHPVSQETIDRALVILFKGPSSFTGEDVVEYHLHGGRAVIDSMVDALSHLNGHRLAEPGEFTRRAFENGRMDLTAAEAVADLINAETSLQKEQALQQMGGALAELYQGWTQELAHHLAHLEADIDFPDEDLPGGVTEAVRPKLEKIRQEICDHLSDNRRGEILRDGIQVAVIGAPNAGKSSLVNALSRRDVAIVSDMAGTTRDVIEVHLNLNGYPVTLADTAGLRPGLLSGQGHDAIENEGIKRALRRAENADLRLLVFDASQAEDGATLALRDEKGIVVYNKADLGRQKDGLNVSAMTGAGMDQLIAALTQAIAKLIGERTAPALTRERHRAALNEAADSLQRALQAALPELMAEDVRLAVRALGRITGRVDVEDLLDMIFRDFCIGK
jgi:tRNA modification GTPase